MLVAIFIFNLIAALVLSGIGNSRECGSFNAFWLSFLCPIIGLIYVALSKRKKTAAEVLADLKIYKENGIIDDKTHAIIMKDIAAGKVRNVEYYTQNGKKKEEEMNIILGILCAAMILFVLFVWMNH